MQHAPTTFAVSPAQWLAIKDALRRIGHLPIMPGGCPVDPECLIRLLNRVANGTLDDTDAAHKPSSMFALCSNGDGEEWYEER